MNMSSQKWYQEESAKRTPENSPAIYRWERSTFQPQSAKRTTETLCLRITSAFLSPVSRALYVKLAFSQH